MDIKSIDFVFIFNSIEYFLSNQRNFSKKQFISIFSHALSIVLFNKDKTLTIINIFIRIF